MYSYTTGHFINRHKAADKDLQNRGTALRYLKSTNEK